MSTQKPGKQLAGFVFAWQLGQWLPHAHTHAAEERLWGFALVDLQDVFLRRAKHDLLPFPSLLHLALEAWQFEHFLRQ